MPEHDGALSRFVCWLTLTHTLGMLFESVPAQGICTKAGSSRLRFPK